MLGYGICFISDHGFLNGIPSAFQLCGSSFCCVVLRSYLDQSTEAHYQIHGVQGSRYLFAIAILCSVNWLEHGTAPRVPKILALDGGGVRGLSSLMILREIMEDIGQEKDADDELLPCDYFDLICGTSTGGLIAIMLGILGMVSSPSFLYTNLNSPSKIASNVIRNFPRKYLTSIKSSRVTSQSATIAAVSTTTSSNPSLKKTLKRN
jgi:Patatin-like phospholipase